MKGGEPNPPELQIKLTECFALKEHPRLCEGKLPVKLWLCAPDGKRIESTFNWPAFKANHLSQSSNPRSRRNIPAQTGFDDVNRLVHFTFRFIPAVAIYLHEQCISSNLKMFWPATSTRLLAENPTYAAYVGIDSARGKFGRANLAFEKRWHKLRQQALADLESLSPRELTNEQHLDRLAFRSAIALRECEDFTRGRFTPQSKRARSRPQPPPPRASAWRRRAARGGPQPSFAAQSKPRVIFPML